ncbi:hypothetical protein V7448_17115, partial [Bacillus altitudinis]
MINGKKIKGYSKKTVERILNTVWDIYHVRLIEQSFFKIIVIRKRYFYHISVQEMMLLMSYLK